MCVILFPSLSIFDNVTLNPAKEMVSFFNKEEAKISEKTKKRKTGM